MSTVPGVDAAPTTPASISEPINTVQLIERARAEKTEVPTILGIVVILVMSALAGLITYVVRATG